MKVWPIILDSQPSYLRSTGRSASLLHVPFGTHALIEHVTAAVRPVTDNHPTIIAPAGVDPEFYRAWVKRVCATAHVVFTPGELAAILAAHELSDAMLFV